jgi:hypothetical protein
MTHYLNGFVPDVECTTCNGHGEVCGVNPNRRSRFVGMDDLSPDDFTVECQDCGGRFLRHVRGRAACHHGRTLPARHQRKAEAVMTNTRLLTLRDMLFIIAVAIPAFIMGMVAWPAPGGVGI